jgi:hypothetical protein
MRPFVLAALLLAGCHPEPIPPTITNVNAPATAMPGDTVTVEIAFQDPDDAVVSVHIVFPSIMQSYLSALPMPVYTGAGIGVGLQFPTNTPPGTIEVDLAVVDQSGLESAPAKVMVTIQ